MNETRKMVSKGIFYTAISKYSNIVLSIIIMSVLGRLLTADDFDIVAVAMVFIYFWTPKCSLADGIHQLIH